jgi:hypothetical protein
MMCDVPPLRRDITHAFIFVHVGTFLAVVYLESIPLLQSLMIYGKDTLIL